MELKLHYNIKILIGILIYFILVGNCYARKNKEKSENKEKEKLERLENEKPGAYMRKANDGFTIRNSWMSKIRDDVQLSELALPGTHASATFDGNEGLDKSASMVTQVLPFPISLIVKQVVKEVHYHQALNFQQQLEFGIRVLEINILFFNGQLNLVQKGAFLYLTFEDFINKVADFLAENPSETVLITLKVEMKLGSNQKTPSAALNEILSRARIGMYYLKTHNPTTTLKEARGKFIIVSIGPEFVSDGLNFKTDSFKVMDHNYIRTGWDLHSWKWKPVKDHLKIATTGDKNVFYVDYLHAWGLTFPYFPASGQALPITDSPRLWTGFPTLGWKWPFPEFPRKCFLFFCVITFEGINKLTRNVIAHFNKHITDQKRTVGIIIADYPGDSLIETIIKNNALLEKKTEEKTTLVTKSPQYPSISQTYIDGEQKTF